MGSKTLRNQMCQLQPTDVLLFYPVAWSIACHDLITWWQPYSKICGSYVVTLLNWTIFFKWLILRFVLENGHQKATYYGEIRLDVIKVFTTF